MIKPYLFSVLTHTEEVMQSPLSHPWVDKVLPALILCGIAMLVVKGLGFDTESFLGLVFYSWIFAIIGFGLGLIFVEATHNQYNTTRPRKRVVISRITGCTILAAYVGWLLWQPWLWLTS